MSWIEAMNSPTSCPHGQAMVMDPLPFPVQETEEPIVQVAACPNLPTAQETFSCAEEAMAMDPLPFPVQETEEPIVQDAAFRNLPTAQETFSRAEEVVRAMEHQEATMKEKIQDLEARLKREEERSEKLEKDLTKEKTSVAKLQEDLTKEKASTAKLQEDLTKEKASAARYIAFVRKTHLECHNLSRNLHGSAETEQSVQYDNRQPEGASAPPAPVSIAHRPTMPEGEPDAKITMEIVDAPNESLAVSDGFEKEVGPLPAILKGVDIKKEGAD
ncbi:hypothetical protein Bbelb_100920 [Branchiostoma belcheri]|nr:hypothetical protein Bbelb_100920 [Branchiostoma belcheri]